MTSRINIPFKAIENLPSGSLDLVNPNRCSRCNSDSAPYFENHFLKYRGGYIRSHAFKKDFHSTVTFQLRLPICENCYQKNFIEAPETMKHDGGPLAGAARLRAAGIVTGSLVACVAFILLMKVIPLPAVLAAISYLWLYPIGLAALIFGITYGLSAIKNQQIESMLKMNNFDIQLHRASVIAKVQFEKPMEDDTSVVIELANDDWALECAKINGWKSSASETQIEKESEK